MNLSWMGSSKDGDYEEKNRVSSYRGYCYKMRRSHNLLAPQWGKRWFSIEGRFLRWYRQESDVSPSGMIDLRHVRSISKVDISGSYTFCVSCEDRNLIMRANSVVEMNSWFRALHIHADIARGGSGMNVVSDFNEAPLRSKNILQSARNSKSRSRLSLEEEIDLNLQKLNDLELEVATPDFIIEEKAGDSFDNNSDALNDFHYEQQPVHRSKVASKRAPPHQSSNPMAEPPEVYRPRPAAKVPQPKTAPISKPDLHRSDSTESLENIPVTSRARAARSYRNEETASAAYKQPPASRRVGRIPADGDISDEFDQSTDSVTPPKSFHARSSGHRSHHRDESPSSSMEKKQSNRTQVRRFQAPSYDEDDAQFSNVSNMTSDDNRRGRNPIARPAVASAVLGGNHPLRNSSARAAWN